MIICFLLGVIMVLIGKINPKEKKSHEYNRKVFDGEIEKEFKKQ